MEIRSGEVHIWRNTLNEKQFILEKQESLLSEEEKRRCNEYMYEAEKVRYTCNHRFVRQVLSNYMKVEASSIEFSIANLGKPFIKNAGLFFNYSYRDKICVLAISRDAEIGIDIEKIKLLHDLNTFAAFSFSERERKIIFESSPEKFESTLFTFWTFKEAIIKALGIGLNADLTQIDLSDFLYHETNQLTFANHDLYTIKSIKSLDGYKSAIAIRGKINSIIEFDNNKIFANKG